MHKLSSLQALQDLFTPKPEVPSWQEETQKLIYRPDGTKEFDDLVDRMLSRLSEGHSPSEASAIISRQLNILYYRKHPREDLKQLMAIL